MKQKGFGVPEAVIICVLILVIGLLGWKYMDTQQNKSDNKDKRQTDSSMKTNENNKDNVSKPSIEEEKIAVARAICTNPELTTVSDAMAKFSSQYVIIENDKYAHFAGACAESEETAMSGSHAFAYKENGTWIRFISGNGDLPCDSLKDKGFPQDMVIVCEGPTLE